MPNQRKCLVCGNDAKVESQPGRASQVWCRSDTALLIADDEILNQIEAQPHLYEQAKMLLNACSKERLSVQINKICDDGFLGVLIGDISDWYLSADDSDD